MFIAAFKFISEINGLFPSSQAYIVVVRSGLLMENVREGGTMYQKEIIYIGLYRNGNRLGSAGFLKIERRDVRGRLFLKLQNIPRGISGRFPVRISTGENWKELSSVAVKDGGCVWEEEIEDAAQGVRLQIILPEGYLIEGRGKDIEQRTDTGQDHTAVRQYAEPTAGKAPEQTAEPAVETWDGQPQNADMRYGQVSKPLYEEKDKETAEPEDGMRIGQTQDADMGYEQQPKRSLTPDWERAERQEHRRESSRSMLAETALPGRSDVKEDKWEQILSAYEQIHPYGDERVYVKLEPKDFIILQAKYQNLVNNSFLLHGFYNYRYVILGKEDEYYLGVPGVFYEREKMVALMFGFEAFECPGGSAKAGDFGYYLRKVEL